MPIYTGRDGISLVQGHNMCCNLEVTKSEKAKALGLQQEKAEAQLEAAGKS